MNDQPKQELMPMESNAATMLEGINRAEIDTQIATAKRYPRMIEKAKANMTAMVSSSPETAADCFYVLPRGKNRIDGPGIRLAEIVGQNWGNIRIMTRPPIIDQARVTIEWSAMDLESNYGTTGSVSTNILYGKNHPYKAGQRYDEDMINTICLATIAKARRNATFAIVPGTIIKEMHQLARHISTGGDDPIESKREKAMSYFRKLGVSDERIFAAVKRSSIEQLTLDDIADLRGIFTSIKDKLTTIDQAFPPVAGSETEQSDKAKDLTERLKGSGVTPPKKTTTKKTKPAEVNNDRTGEPAGPSPFELLIEQLANKCDAQHADAATRLLDFIGKVLKATPDTLTTSQVEDIKAKIKSGEISVK